MSFLISAAIFTNSINLVSPWIGDTSKSKSLLSVSSPLAVEPKTLTVVT